jgi:ADP-heptose:LPS heptosyltransferase
MALDFFRGLRKRFPDALITLAAPSSIEGIADPSLFDSFRGLSGSQRTISGGARLWSGLRKQKFDLGVVLPASASAAFLMALAGPKRSVGYSEALSRWLLTDGVRWPGRSSGKHKAELYQELLHVVGGAPVERVSRPVSRSAGSDYWVLAPGASISLRQWPWFVDLARQLRLQFPSTSVRVVGAASDGHWDDKFNSLGDPGVESFIGLTTLPELIALCAGARAVVSNDSGTGHIASEFSSTPTLVLFGPGDPSYVLPEGAHFVRAESVPCSPCESATCRGAFGYQACLKQLAVEKVISEIRKLI